MKKKKKNTGDRAVEFGILLGYNKAFMDEKDLVLAQRLAAVELARLSGTKDYTLEEFRKNMLEATDQGVHSNF